MSEAQLKSPIKILLITDLYPIGNDNTIPFAIENFALAISELDANLSVIRPNFIFNTIIRKHKIYKTGIYKRNGITIYNRNFLLPFLFDNFTPEGNFDLIISHMPSGHIYADLINKKLNLPRISILHNSDYRVLNDIKYSVYFKNRLKKAIQNSNLLGARNSNLKEKLNADFILPSFIDKRFILNKKQPQEKLKIITISRLIKRKNIDMVTKTLSKLKIDFDYNIYGDGREKRKLEKYVKKYNLQNKIIFHGKIKNHEIWKKLDESDIFILPSTDETFGLSYLEAMARGLITVAKKQESMDNIIEDNVNGFLVNNSDDIKNILENLTLDKKQEIMKNTLINIKNYEKEKVLFDYMKIIKSLVK